GSCGKGTILYEPDLFYYHPNHLGSTSFVTDVEGEIYQHLEYFPFGETWIEEVSNQHRVPFLFTAKELDRETGLYYFGARYYDPRTSVWQSPDPILGDYLPSGDKEKDKKLPGMGGIFKTSNLGLFTYAFNNPIIVIDPTGLSGTLTIYSEGDGGSFMSSGHSWISFTPDKAAVTTTYGTWGNDPGGKGNGLHKNLETGRVGDVSRTVHISDAAEAKLFDHIKKVEKLGEDGWVADTPCSSFARDAWGAGTGEKLDSNWGPISNPTTLKESIIEKNGGKNNLTVKNPEKGSSMSGSSASSKQSSGSISVRPLDSSL
ncbi:MAG: RHS repeat-associated core domain-containing protein, partial [Candidatus Electrothrix sp. AUS3]|nr:RHS repeat-associated core domain-containing protein [Candidatus Electrothrix gigas]